MAWVLGQKEREFYTELELFFVLCDAGTYSVGNMAPSVPCHPLTPSLRSTEGRAHSQAHRRLSETLLHRSNLHWVV